MARATEHSLLATRLRFISAIAILEPSKPDRKTMTEHEEFPSRVTTLDLASFKSFDHASRHDTHLL
jgi:hypothetical protein